MKQQKYLYALLIPFLLLACNTDEERQMPIGKASISVDVGVNQTATRTNFEGSAFKDGDSFTLYEGEPKTSDVMKTDYIYNGGSWSANPLLYWDDLSIWDGGGIDKTKAIEFTAVLTNGGTLNLPSSGESSFDIVTAPGNETEFLKSDLLVAYDKQLPTLTSGEFNKVKLIFNHVMARLRIVIEDKTTGVGNAPILGSNTKLELKALIGNKITFGNADTKTTTVIADGTETKVALLHTGVSGQKYTYEIILPAQSLREATSILTISGNANGKVYTYNMSTINKPTGKDADGTNNLLQQGCTTLISLSIQKTELKFGKVEVTDWTPKSSHGTATPNDYPIIEIGTGTNPDPEGPGTGTGDDYAGKTLRLTEDVTLDELKTALGLTEMPLGTKETPFRGTFDGQGFSITNVDLNSNEDFLGIFGYTDGATIKNLNVTGTGVKNTSTNSSTATGGLVGYANNTLIINCHVDYKDGTGVSAAYDNAGGLVGYVVGGTRIEYCSTNTKVLAGHNYAGGLVGRTLAGTSIKYSFAKKYNTSSTDYTVTAGYYASEPYVDGYYAGGLVGACVGTNIEYCYSWSDAKAARYVGGFVGRYESNTSGVTNTLQYCYAAGFKINGNNAGGMVGHIEMRSGKPDKCYWNSMLGVGFIGLYTSGGTNSSFTLTNTQAAMNNVLTTLNDNGGGETEWELTTPTLYGGYVFPILLKNKGEAKPQTEE